MDNVSVWLDDYHGPKGRSSQLPPAGNILRWVQEAQGRQHQLAHHIIYALHVSIIPCQEVAHVHAEKRHYETCTRHRGLRHTYNIKGGKHLPSNAKTSLELSIYRSKPNIPGLWLGQDRKIYPSFSRLHHLFFGLPGLQENKEICLHKDAPSKPLLQYSIKDIDSSIAIFSNLNSFQASIYLAIIPQPSQLLQQSIHLSYTIKVDRKQQDVPIHKIPHILL
ncbi:hypothetical protein B0T25DRAFT_611619, partial [Lasiosphaeria hispida]